MFFISKSTYIHTQQINHTMKKKQKFMRDSYYYGDHYAVTLFGNKQQQPYYLSGIKIII